MEPILTNVPTLPASAAASPEHIWSPLDEERWRWADVAREATRPAPEGRIFSTFPEGEEPPVWPPLPQATASIWTDLAAGSAAALLLLAFYLLFLATRRTSE